MSWYGVTPLIFVSGTTSYSPFINGKKKKSKSVNAEEYAYVVKEQFVP